MKKKLLALLLVTAMSVGCMACGSTNEDSTSTSDGASTSSDATGEGTSSTGGNTVVIAMGSGFSTLDPGYMYEQNPTLVANACYETLFKFVDGKDEPLPSLAESYEFSEDGLSCTIKLNQKATFASGNPVTSADVAFSLNRTKNLQGNPSFICANISSIDTPDDYTVVINQTTADSALLSKLCYAACSVLDSQVVKENGGTDAEDAATTDTAQAYLDSTSAGSGMYVLTSYTADEEILLEKNENYYGTVTNVDKYIIKLQDDANTQMMGLSSGDIDIALNLTDDTMSELDGNESVATINSSTKTVGFLMMNEDETLGGPVSDPTVQQAIKYALDFAGIQTICGEGSVTPESIIQVGFMGSAGAKDVTTSQDLEKAKALMKEAGYESGFTIEMPVCELDMEGVALLDLAQKVKSDLAAINITVNIEQQDWAGGFGDDYRNGKIGFTVMYWGIDYNDPNVQLVFLPGQEVGLRANWTVDGQDEIISLYNQILSATDNTSRSELLTEVQSKISDNSPFLMLAQAACHVGYNSRLNGVNFSDTYRIDVTTVNVK
ncbi:MAG: ABC transporter substrate-binding protein [Lachnotalea sp.]